MSPSTSTTPVRVPFRSSLSGPASWILGVWSLLVVAMPAIAAGPVYWDWPQDRPFTDLELDGVALDSDGQLGPGLTSRILGPDGPEVFWRVVADGKGGFYSGSGHGGEIHQTDAGGESTLVVDLEGTEIFSLLRLGNGDLLAGCGPEGRVFEVNADHEARQVAEIPGGYVWDMVASDEGSVWLATGSPAVLYELELKSGVLTRTIELPAQNILNLALDPDGRLLVATQGPGLIYALASGSNQPPVLLFETPQDEVRQFIQGPEGEMFALALETEQGMEDPGELMGQTASNGNGKGNGPVRPSQAPSMASYQNARARDIVAPAALYRLRKDGRVDPWWRSSAQLMIAAWTPELGWVGGGPLPTEGSRTRLLRLTPPAGEYPIAGWEGGDILDILPMGTGSRNPQLVVAQAHPGGMVILGTEGESARAAVSPPLDGGRPLRWGRLRWSGKEGKGRLQWSVRTGNRSVPDETWSKWSGKFSDQDHALEAAPARYLQWRVEFPSGNDPAAAWEVHEVSVSAWQDNLAPVVANFTLEQLQDIQMGGLMMGSDHVTHTYSSGLRAEFSLNARQGAEPGPERPSMGRTVRIFTWQGWDPDGDRLLYRLEYRNQGQTLWRPVDAGRPGQTETPETLLSWDTSEVPDGRYEVRLTATDRLDNPNGQALTGSYVFGPLEVDHTPPAISGFDLDLTEDGFAVNFKAKDAATVLADARIRLPDGRYERLDPVDRICDSTEEKFQARIAWPRDGQEPGSRPWAIRVEVRDMGGNLASAEGDLP